MVNPWHCLENIHGVAGVAALWQSWLGENYGNFKQAFLRKRERLAESYPCPHECGCAHTIVPRRDGSFVAVCRCEPANCEDFSLGKGDLAVWELIESRLGRAIAWAFESNPIYVRLLMPDSIKVIQVA